MTFVAASSGRWRSRGDQAGAPCYGGQIRWDAFHFAHSPEGCQQALQGCVSVWALETRSGR